MRIRCLLGMMMVVSMCLEILVRHKGSVLGLKR